MTAIQTKLTNKNCLVIINRHSSYLSFESFFESEDGRVDGVFELHVVVEPFLQKRFPVHVVLPHRGRLPSEVGAGGIALEQSVKRKNRKVNKNYVFLLTFIIGKT